jgi:hypothetical protein
MEDDNLTMGIFEKGMELNLNTFENFDDTTDDDELITDEPVIEKDNQVEDDSSEEVDKEDVENEGDDEGGESSSNLYSSLATVVYEQGLLPSLNIAETPIKSVEDLVNAFKKEQESQALKLNEDFINNIDVNKIAESKRAIQDLSNITEDSLRDDLQLAKSIIKRDLENQGLDANKTSRMLKRLIDLGDDALIEDSLESLESLKEFENRQIDIEKTNYTKRIEQEKVEQQNLENSLRETIYDSKELIKGLKLTKSIQDKVYKNITEVIGKSPEGEFENKFMKDRRENPLEFETRMHMFYELTNGFKDFTKLSRPATSNAVRDLEKIARQQKTIDNGTPFYMQDSNSYDNTSGHVLNM